MDLKFNVDSGARRTTVQNFLKPINASKSGSPNFPGIVSPCIEDSIYKKNRKKINQLKHA